MSSLTSNSGSSIAGLGINALPALRSMSCFLGLFLWATASLADTAEGSLSETAEASLSNTAEGSLSNTAEAPKTTWSAEELKALERDAMRLPRLHNFLLSVNGDVLIEQHYRGPRPDQPTNIKSLSKTVLAALVGAALERQVFSGVDQPIVELLGERVPEGATDGVDTITVGHLLSLQAGLERTSGRNYGRWVASDNWVDYILTRPFVDKPGGTMLYSTGSSHLLSAALAETTGRSTLALAREWLGEPLEMDLPDWPQDPQGIHFGGNDMQISPRDLLKVAELYRQGGELDGERVFSESWVRSSWQGRGYSAYTDDPYGYGWFSVELAGVQAYYGRGYGGQAMYVIPELGVTAVMTSDPTPPSPGFGYLNQLHALLINHVIPVLQPSGNGSP